MTLEGLDDMVITVMMLFGVISGMWRLSTPTSVMTTMNSASPKETCWSSKSK